MKIRPLHDRVLIKRLDEDGDKIEEVTVIEDGVATRTRKKVKKVKVPRPIMDPISVIYHLRTLDLTPGKSHELELIADGKLYTVHAKVVRRERVQTPAGVFNCVRVEPRMTSGGVDGSSFSIAADADSRALTRRARPKWFEPFGR